MANLPLSSRQLSPWSAEAQALAAQAKVLSGNKLEQLVIRLQRHTGRSKEACWRFIIQYGIKGRIDHRRWTENEIDVAREELVKKSVEEVAQKLQRTPSAVRSMLRRHSLSLREIRCDRFSVESLAIALHIRKAEIRFWIEQGWLEASVNTHGKKTSVTITPEGLTLLYKRHLPDILKPGIRNQSLFEVYLQYCYSPKHTVGEQLLDVRQDKRERSAYASLQGRDRSDDGKEEGMDNRKEPCPEGIQHDENSKFV